MIALLLSAVISLASHSTATPAHRATVTHSDHFPARGVVVPGRTIGGISLGMTEVQVRRLWGNHYTVCGACGPVLTWLYEYPGAEPLGAAVKFSTAAKPAAVKSAAVKSAGSVVAVFTLGSPAGWGLKGLMMGDPLSNVYSIFPNPVSANCIGYSALWVRAGADTTSFYAASGVIYGYALTAASQSPCQ